MNHIVTKVLLVIHTPPPWGGGEIQALNLKTKLATDKRYIIYDYSRKSHSRSDWEGLKFKPVIYGIIWIIKVTFLIIWHRPQKLYLTLPKGFYAFIRNAMVFPIARLFKTKILGELPGTSFPFLDNPKSFRYKIGLSILKRVDEIRFLSNTIAKNHEIFVLKKSVIILNGTNLPEKTFVNKSIFEKTPLSLIYVGSLETSKGIHNSISAIKYCNEYGIKVHLNIIGYWVNNDDKRKNENYILEHSLEKNITFHGLRTGDEKWEIFKNSGILIHPTYWDGVPLTILEALGLGLTVISTSIGGIPDTIKNKINGTILSENTPEHLADAILYYYNNRQLLRDISERNKRLFKTKYNISIFLNEMEKWFLC